MNIILFDDKNTRAALMPFALTRAVAAMRIGIFTISEKWEKLAKCTVSFLTEAYLSKKFDANFQNQNVYINGAWIPNADAVLQINFLKENTGLYYKNQLVALKSTKNMSFEEINTIEVENKIEIENVNLLQKSWQIFQQNGAQIRADFELIAQQNKSEKITDEFTKCYNPNQIFVEKGAKIYAAILNASNGPIYIGKNAEIQEGAMIRGPFAICEGSVVNMGSKIRGDVTIGPFSKVGGEVSNSVIFGFSNKGHDGFLGNSVIGEWCNLGADTNTSNLKNNYSNVGIYNYQSNDYEDTGLMFCGLMMGDHSKCGINTMFNTGTVVGVNANIFGGHFPPKFIPSFSWGGSEGMMRFEFNKAIEIAKKVFERRNQTLSNLEIEILKHISEQYNKV